MKTIKLCFLTLFAIFAFQQKIYAEISENSFRVKKVEIKISDVITIDSTAKWYLNFERLKNSVVYSNKIISMGLYGGIVCINPKNMAVDEVFTKKINTDFYTNIICRQDTLFTEKFGDVFYLGTDTVWTKYTLKLPVKLFEILYEDEHYIFYPSNFGEWGSYLFIYDKYLQCTKGLRVSYCPQAVIKQKNEYIISGGSWGGVVSSELYSIKDLDKLKVLVEGNSTASLEKLKKLWVSWFGSEKLDYSYSQSFIQSIKLFDSGISSSIFQQDSILYLLKQKSYSTQCASLVNLYTNKQIKIDSINFNYLNTAHQFGKNTIISCTNLKNNFLYINSDTIYNISYLTNKSWEREKEFRSDINHFFFSVRGDTIKSNFITKYNYDNSNNSRVISLIYDFNEDTRINYLTKDYDYSNADFYIIQNGTKHNLKIKSKNNFLGYCFKYHGNDFLYFQNSGNTEHKYGLIEILDLKRFINKYGDVN
ncbi:MAG TPA: hypothetical protein VK152_07960 [Paludibacter sp.]|nr:hypothetical protein [Paludibacter sp.]